MMRPVARKLPDGRLHLQHGPVDLVIGADGKGREQAFGAASERFETILQQLVDELLLLRAGAGETRPAGPVARRMYDAVMPHSGTAFVTLMAAVAGAVADEVLAVMQATPDVGRAYVNNGGDIALFLGRSASFRLAMAGLDNGDLGRIRITGRDDVRGIATSGRGGRSLSMGIADSVTVLARTAAAADVAATLIANAVDLPGHPAITRVSASEIDPDSDLGHRLVVRHCATLPAGDVSSALSRGAHAAHRMQRAGLISGAALFLQGACELVSIRAETPARKIAEHA